MIAALRDHHDRAIVKRFHVNASSVAIKRRELGMPKRLPHHLAATWTPAMLKQLGTRLDGDLAKEFGLSARTVSAKRQELGIPRLRPTKLDWASAKVLKLLGSAPDSRIARVLGVTTDTVRVKRTAAGIPPFFIDRWTPEIVARMGTVPDRVIAYELGVDNAAVAWQRRQRRIRRWGKHGRDRLPRRRR